MAGKDQDRLIRRHYKEQAEKHGDAKFSTMADENVRDREIESLFAFLSGIQKKRRGRKPLRVLDLGCGNGYTLTVLSARFPEHQFTGVEYTPELLRIARRRNLENVRFARGDARKLRLPDGSQDVVYTERCLINILDWGEQQQALAEIHRVLRRGGHYLMMESFTDGLENYNRARRELGLPPVPEPYHNRFFDKELFLECIKGLFIPVDPKTVTPRNHERLQPNFLSSHFFISRVVYPALTKRKVVHNSEFVRFFSFLPPVGEYSPIQIHILKKWDPAR